MSDEAALFFALDVKLNKLERAMARAEARTQQAANKIEKQFNQANKKVTEGLANSATGLARLGQVTGAQRFVIQNTANQFGDLAVQISSGTTASRALSQQLPQLLGGFGALGGTLGTLGPIMGVVAAIGLPLAAMFFNMADGAQSAADQAQSLEKSFDALSAAVSDYAAAADLSIDGTEKLQEKYGSFADEVQRALDIQQKLKRNAAANQLADVASQVGSKFGSLDITDINAGGASAYEITLRKIRDEMDLTAGQAVQLATALSRVMNASDTQGQVNAISGLVDTYAAIYGSVEAADTATGNFVSELVKAVKAGNELLGTTERVAEAQNLLLSAANALPGALAAAKSEASGLADTIWDAAKGAWDAFNALAQNRAAANSALDQMKVEFSAGGQAMINYGSRTPGGTAAQNALATRNAPRKRASRAGSGSSISKEEAADLAAAKSLYEATRTAAENYANELERINRLKEKGLISDETYQRGIDQLKEKLGGIGEVGATAANALRSAFQGIFDDPQAALKQLAQQLAQMAIYMQLAKSFPGAFGAGGIIPLAGARASGGPVSANRPYLVGERGPEIVMPASSGYVVPNHAIGSERKSGGGNTYVHVENTTGQRSQTERYRGPTGDEIIRVKVGEQIARGDHDKIMKGRFGSGPVPVKR